MTTCKQGVWVRVGAIRTNVQPTGRAQGSLTVAASIRKRELSNLGRVHTLQGAHIAEMHRKRGSANPQRRGAMQEVRAVRWQTAARGDAPAPFRTETTTQGRPRARRLVLSGDIGTVSKPTGTGLRSGHHSGVKACVVRRSGCVAAASATPGHHHT